MWQKLDVNTKSNRFDIVPSYALLLLLGFSKILIYSPLPRGGELSQNTHPCHGMQIFFHSVKSFAKIDASRFKCIISENDQKNCLIPPPATFLLTTSSLVCSGKRWFRVYHSMLCISFPRQYICLYQSLFLSFFSHFPIQLHCIFYYEYRIPK